MRRLWTLGIASTAAVALASVALLGDIASAQQPTPAATAPAASAATPRTADGRPDLSGFWGSPAGIPGVGGEKKVSEDGKRVEWQIATPTEIIATRGSGAGAAGATGRPPMPAAARNRPEYKPELVHKLQENIDTQVDSDPAFVCMPLGVPRLGPPDQIFQSRDAVVFLYSGRGTFRVIPTDGRPHDMEADTSFNGEAVGRWEGDTLVVDVRRRNNETWLDGSGTFHSEKLHVTERLTRVGDNLRYEVTVEDPEVLVKPWVQTPRMLKLGAKTSNVVEEPPCFDQDQKYMVEKHHRLP